MIKTKQIDTHEVKAGDVVFNSGYQFEVAETFFFTDHRGREVFRYRTGRCLNPGTLPSGYCVGAVYGHNADMLVTVIDEEGPGELLAEVGDTMAPYDDPRTSEMQVLEIEREAAK